MTTPQNTLYYGDNLTILREYIATASVDLVYLDPPFNSSKNYNLLFKEKSGQASAAQLEAFADTWQWDQAAAATLQELRTQAPTRVRQMVDALYQLLGSTDMMAYLVMMASRLVELHRVLKPTGSLYLHCDPTASHYLKVVMDAIFGIANYQNEISWRRTTTKGDYHQGATNWPRIRDVILHYRKDIRQKGTFHQPFAPYSDEYIGTKYRYKDANGRVYRLDNLTAPGAGTRGHPRYEFLGVTRYWRYNREKMESLLNEGRILQTKPGTVPQYKRYLDEVPGIAIGDTWEDIAPINAMAAERLAKTSSSARTHYPSEQQSRRPGARSVLRLRDRGCSGAEVGPALDWH
jgi:DNA methylase